MPSWTPLYLPQSWQTVWFPYSWGGGVVSRFSLHLGVDKVPMFKYYFLVSLEFCNQCYQSGRFWPFPEASNQIPAFRKLPLLVFLGAPLLSTQANWDAIWNSSTWGALNALALLKEAWSQGWGSGLWFCLCDARGRGEPTSLRLSPLFCLGANSFTTCGDNHCEKKKMGITPVKPMALKTRKRAQNKEEGGAPWD